MRAQWLRAALASLMLIGLGGTCGPFDAESPPPTVTATELTPSPTPSAIATAPPAPIPLTPGAATPTPTPTPAPTAPAETPAPEPTTAVNLYMPTAGVADARPTAAAPGGPAAEDPMAERLRRFVQEGIREEFPEAEAQPVHVFRLGLPGAADEFWGAVTDGPQPARITSDDEVVNFFHFAAAYRLSQENEWLEVDRLEIESAPQRTQIDLTPIGWVLADGAPAAWITVRGGTGAHAGTLDIIRFDGETLRTEISWLSARPNAGEVADLDGDGTAEVVVNAADPYVFCYACAVELKREILYWWDGSRLVPVDLRAPVAGVPAGVASEVDEVVALARAGLWRDAALAAIAAARQAPESAQVRWLSVLVNRTAAARLIHAGSVAQPLLATVFAGEYGAAVELMRAHEPAQAFALDGPLIVDTEAERDLATMATQMLEHTTRALDAAPDRAEIHAVHALALTLASPDDLAPARTAMQRAAELAPDDPFYAASRDFLAGVPRAPGTPPSPPDGPEPTLPGPSPEFFAEGNLLGSGDRGRNVKALHQRLACLRAPGFNDPGRYFDEYHEATRRAVVRFQADHGLTPTGVIGAVTWNAIEEAAAASPDCNVQTLALPSGARFALARDARLDDASADHQPADDEPTDDQTRRRRRPSFIWVGRAAGGLFHLRRRPACELHPAHAGDSVARRRRGHLLRAGRAGPALSRGVGAGGCRRPSGREPHREPSVAGHPDAGGVHARSRRRGRGHPGRRWRPRRPARLLASALRRRRRAHGSARRRAGEDARAVGRRPAGLAAARRGADRVLRSFARLARGDHPDARRRRRPQPDRRGARYGPRRAFVARLRVSRHSGMRW